MNERAKELNIETKELKIENFRQLKEWLNQQLGEKNVRIFLGQKFKEMAGLAKSTQALTHEAICREEEDEKETLQETTLNDELISGLNKVIAEAGKSLKGNFDNVVRGGCRYQNILDVQGLAELFYEKRLMIDDRGEVELKRDPDLPKKRDDDWEFYGLCRIFKIEQNGRNYNELKQLIKKSYTGDVSNFADQHFLYSALEPKAKAKLNLIVQRGFLSEARRCLQSGNEEEAKTWALKAGIGDLDELKKTETQKVAAV